MGRSEVLGRLLAYLYEGEEGRGDACASRFRYEYRKNIVPRPCLASHCLIGQM
jgi:hypothetical protein